jgi:hypothetical protein
LLVLLIIGIILLAIFGVGLLAGFARFLIYLALIIGLILVVVWLLRAVLHVF